MSSSISFNKMTVLTVPAFCFASLVVYHCSINGTMVAVLVSTACATMATSFEKNKQTKKEQIIISVQGFDRMK